MENDLIKRVGFLFLTGILLVGCVKNQTRYHDDAEDPGLAVFSNTGNNILSCFIDGKPWRTESRKFGGFNSRPNYEVYIDKKIPVGTTDTLIITWFGYFQGNELNTGNLSLHIAVPANFTYKSLSALKEQRLRIDAANGYFSTSINGLNPTNIKGNGSLYFHTARFDSIAVNSYSGEMSGLFDANFTAFKIVRGRFDHALSVDQIHF